MAAVRTSCCAAILLLLLCGAAARARDIKIATWNMEWLTLRPDGPELPEDAHPKRLDDIVTLAGYAERLHADLIGIEEVDGPEIAARIFPPDTYRIEMTHDSVVQRVGLVIRRDFAVTRNPDLTALNTYGAQASHPLRSGLDVTLSRDGQSLRVLVVHLKTGCWDNKLAGHPSSPCRTLKQQQRILEQWLAAREAEGGAFVLMGDFNRNMPVHDDFLDGLEQAAPMALATAGYASPCWGGEAFIDHILLGGPARRWVQPNSLRVMVYREKDPAMKERISDHCPVSVRLGFGR